jgi:hypothetical protein
MIVIKGDVTCLALEENLWRFLQVIEWCHTHKCLLKKNKIIITISECGIISEYDEEFGLELDICEVYHFRAVCKSCGKKAKSLYEEE